MGLVRPAQPSQMAIPGFKVEAYGTSTAMPVGISSDRKTVYGSALGAGNTLYQSTDDGATWSSVHSFSPDLVTGIQETDDGEALVTTGTAAGSVYKSSGWSSSPTSATWTQVLAAIGGQFRGQWSGAHPWAFGNDLIRPGTSKFGVINEYGNQTTGSGDQTAKGRRVWKTENYGATWTQIFDVFARYPVASMHVHASVYDPYWDRIWITIGDVTNPDGAGYTKLLYSDDHGGTWAVVPKAAEFGSLDAQWTSIAVTKTAIIVGADLQHGWYRIARRGSRKMGDCQLVAALAGGLGNAYLALGVHQNRTQSGAPLLVAGTSQNPYCTGGVLISLDDGATLTQLWEDPLLRGSAKGCWWAIGPTYNGKTLVWTSQSGADPGSGTHWMARGEIVIPEPGLLDVQTLCTGNGSTTVFNYAHGLGFKPSRYMGWPEKVGPLTVTADSTNIIITFATAPANAAVIPVQLRYAA